MQDNIDTHIHTVTVVVGDVKCLFDRSEVTATLMGALSGWLRQSGRRLRAPPERGRTATGAYSVCPINKEGGYGTNGVTSPSQP